MTYLVIVTFQTISMHRISSYLKLRKNVIESRRKQIRNRFGSTEELCEHIGRGLCEQIDDGDITIQQVLEDSVQFSLITAKDPDSRYFSWLTLHMALGICFRYKVDNRDLIRQILLTLLPFSHGVDYGIYLRDLLENYKQLTVSSVISLARNNIQGEQGLEKSLYFLKYAAGLTINLRDPKIIQSIFNGTGRAVWADLLDRETCSYLDLPVAHAHLQPMMIHQPLTASLHVSSLLLSIMNIKPDVVLLLLRHGVSAEGPPLRYLLRTLGTINLFPTMKRTGYSTFVRLLADILHYCLRTLRNINFKVAVETVGSSRDMCKTYFIKQEVLMFMPTWVQHGVSPLKHLSRCVIRDALKSNDHLPQGIEQLELPTILLDYLDLREPF